MAQPPVTYSSSLAFQLAQVPPPGINDPIVALAISQLWKAVQQLILVTSPGNAGGTTISISSTEHIIYGAAVELYSASGIISARNANAGIYGGSNNVQPCHGFCTTVAGISAGKTGFIDLGPCVINSLSGIVVGQPYWLEQFPGALRTTPYTVSGGIEQFVAVGLSTTSILAKPQAWIQH